MSNFDFKNITTCKCIVIDTTAFYFPSSSFQLNIKFIELLYKQNNSYYKQAHKKTQSHITQFAFNLKCDILKNL